MKVTLKKGLLGLEEYKEYNLFDLKDLKPYKLLQSIEDENIGLVVISPFEIEKDYEIKLSDEVVNELEISSPEDVLIFTTVNLNTDVTKITTNLRAPIVINIKKNLGEQIILQNDVYKIKHPIVKG